MSKSEQDNQKSLDWVGVARSAGLHGIRFPTNKALEAFLADINFEVKSGDDIACGPSAAEDVTGPLGYDDIARIINPEAFSRWKNGDHFDRMQVLVRLREARVKAKQIAAITGLPKHGIM